MILKTKYIQETYYKETRLKEDIKCFAEKKKKKKIVSSLLSFDDYKKSHTIQNSPKRELVRICFLDDEGYVSLDRLVSLGYNNVQVKYQFNSIDEFKDFDVIFCDIQGIGNVQYPTNKGFDVALELKKNYPNCSVFIYTGINISNFPNIPDDIKLVTKQTPIKELVSILDNECEYLWNPERAWEKTELKLRSSGASNKLIALIEHDFVLSTIKGRNILLEDYNSNKLESFDNVQFFISTAISLIDLLLKFTR